MKLGGRGGFPGPAGIKQASAPSSSRWALLWGGGPPLPAFRFPSSLSCGLTFSALGLQQSRCVLFVCSLLRKPLRAGLEQISA